MPHDETMTRADWLKRARIAGREARERSPNLGRFRSLIVWRRKHAHGPVLDNDVSNAFNHGWNEGLRGNAVA